MARRQHSVLKPGLVALIIMKNKILKHSMDLLKRGTMALLLGTKIWRGIIDAIIYFYFIMEIVVKAQKMKFDKTDKKSNTKL